MNCVSNIMSFFFYSVLAGGPDRLFQLMLGVCFCGILVSEGENYFLKMISKWIRLLLSLNSLSFLNNRLTILFLFVSSMSNHTQTQTNGCLWGLCRFKYILRTNWRINELHMI